MLKMAEFHTKYRDTNLKILLETYKRISYSTVFYQPAVIGTSIKIETKTDENVLENNGKGPRTQAIRNGVLSEFRFFSIVGALDLGDSKFESRLSLTQLLWL